MGETRTCAHCGQVSPSGTRFCPSCGQPIPEPPPETPSYCPNCGKPLAPPHRFCAACGQEVGAPAAAPVLAEPAAAVSAAAPVAVRAQPAIVAPEAAPAPPRRHGHAGWWVLLAVIVLAGAAYGATRLRILPTPVQTVADRAVAWAEDQGREAAAWLDRTRLSLFGNRGGPSVVELATETPAAPAQSPTLSAAPSRTGAAVATNTRAPSATVVTSPTMRPASPTAAGGASVGIAQAATYTPLPTYTPYPTFTAVPSKAPPPPTSTPPLVAAKPTGRIAYTVNKGNFSYDIYTINLDGTGKQLLISNASEPSFTKDGQVLYYNWAGNGVDIRRLDGSGARRVINDGEAAFASVAMDGYTVIYMTGEVDWDRWGWVMKVCTIGLDGQNKRFISEGDQPAWSPTAMQFVSKSCDGNTCGLFVTNSDGSGRQMVTTDANDQCAAWSPSGRRIAFASSRDGNWEIYIANADGSNLQRLTNSPTTDALPLWLPDGEHLAFRSDRGGVWAIYVMRDDGSEVTRVTDAQCHPQRWRWERMAIVP